MSTFWQQKLQSSLQSSLQSVNSTVSSISTDGAARCVSFHSATQRFHGFQVTHVAVLRVPGTRGGDPSPLPSQTLSF